MESQGKECAAVSLGLLIAWRTQAPARTPHSSAQASRTMRSPRSLPYLLLLPLGACFPLLDRRAPLDTGGGGGAGRSWAHLAEGPRPHLARGTPRGLRAPAPLALLVLARQLQTWGQEHTGFHFRFGREVEGTDTDGGDKAAGLLGSLAEELGGYSRKKGGFSFRFGRR